MTEDDYIAFFMILNSTFFNILLPPNKKHWSSVRHEHDSERKTFKRRRLNPKALARHLWTAEESLAISLRACVGLTDYIGVSASHDCHI